ncbi:MAG: hypothetical protein IKX92_06430, partial [Clostridia bacterium]|nr:hypothetical protein [Clostridia bacterium]
EEADVILFNACAVRAHAESRVIGRLGALKPIKERNPRLIVGLCGCMAEEEEVRAAIKALESESVRACAALDDLLESHGYERAGTGFPKAELVRRPGITVREVAALAGDEGRFTPEALERAETEIKYEGYIKRQLAEVERFGKLEEKLLPDDADYSRIKGLRIEAAQKLNAQKPKSIGQASRISGVSPSDVSVLLIWLSQGGRSE